MQVTLGELGRPAVSITRQTVAHGVNILCGVCHIFLGLPHDTYINASDTGYSTASGPCPAFKEIGEKYGPFDLAMIPIWRGASLSILGRMGLRVR